MISIIKDTFGCVNCSAAMSDEEKREDRKRKADAEGDAEKEEEESDSDDGEMIGPLPTEAAPIKKPKVC